MRVYDDQYDDWKPGDKVVWAEDKEGDVLIIKQKDVQFYWIYFCEGGMTRETNLLRVREVPDAH